MTKSIHFDFTKKTYGRKKLNGIIQGVFSTKTITFKYNNSELGISLEYGTVEPRIS